MAYKINTHACLCCHNCASECPVQAIAYHGPSYQVDPNRCIDCGHCSVVCNVGAAYDPNKKQADADTAERSLTCDLAVLGAGAAGLICAVRAAQLTGKKVVVLEKAAKPGGSAWYAHGFTVEGSKRQKDAGIPDTRDEMFRRSMKDTEWALDPKLVQNYIYATGPFFDWLSTMGETEQYFKIRNLHGRNILDVPDRCFYNLKCTDPAIGPGWGGSFVIRKMLEQCRKLGIEILTGHCAKQLFRNEAGAISGVLAERDGGGRTMVKCKACVLATGGWARNDDLLRRQRPDFFAEGGEPIHRFTVPTVTGDVLRLCRSVGAKTREDNMVVNVFGPVHHPYSYCLFRFALQPEPIIINLNGRRWVDESDFTLGHFRIADQPRQIAWSVLDQETLELIANRLIGDPADGTDGWIYERYKKEIEEEVALGTPLKRADTLEELAEQMGVTDIPAFLEEIARFNHYCEQGRDEDFLKRPETLRPIQKAPFYAILGKRATDGAFGGAVINADTNVVAEDGSLIPGLYAAGDNTDGWFIRRGTEKKTVMSDLTWAVASGFLSGGAAAGYLTGSD